jgi:hypothetical protein
MEHGGLLMNVSVEWGQDVLLRISAIELRLKGRKKCLLLLSDSFVNSLACHGLQKLHELLLADVQYSDFLK